MTACSTSAILPTLNAVLNATATVLLVTGYRAIRRRDIDLHKRCMLAAVVTSGLFLTSYLVYHYNAGSRPFTGTGALRAVYFLVLITHVVLAAVNLPMVIATLTRALRGHFVAPPRHRALDVPGVAVRVGDGRGGVPDAVQDVGRGLRPAAWRPRFAASRRPRSRCASRRAAEGRAAHHGLPAPTVLASGESADTPRVTLPLT